MVIEVGQLRRWRPSTTSSGELFLIVSIEDEPIVPTSPIWVGYVQDGETCYDDIDWISEHSEAIREEG